MIELPGDLFEQIVTHAQAELPNEACGVIAGADGRAARVYPMRNAEASPIVYRFDDQEQLEVFNDVEERGWELMAFFHSHTHTEAFPSPTDRAQAHWRDPISGSEAPAYPGTSYVILSLQDRQRPEIRSFHFEDGQPVEEDVRIT